MRSVISLQYVLNKGNVHEVEFQEIESHIFQEIETMIMRFVEGDQKPFFQGIKSFNNICQYFDHEIYTFRHFSGDQKLKIHYNQLLIS